MRNLRNPSGQKTFINVCISGEIDKLPSAGTCSNYLAIPPYPNY